MGNFHLKTYFYACNVDLLKLSIIFTQTCIPRFRHYWIQTENVLKFLDWLQFWYKCFVTLSSLMAKLFCYMSKGVPGMPSMCDCCSEEDKTGLYILCAMHMPISVWSVETLAWKRFPGHESIKLLKVSVFLSFLRSTRKKVDAILALSIFSHHLN